MAQIPSSPRSEDALKRNLSTLQRQSGTMGLAIGNPVFIRIFKESKELEIWIKKDKRYSLFKTYAVCYFSGSLGPKTGEGDNQAPEGFYEIGPAAMNPASSYHLSFNIGYPNEYERAKKYTGSEIMVHGECVSIGCYALGNQNIDEIWTLMVKAFENGQQAIPLQIFPFRMIGENLESHIGSPWKDFWMNLRDGYLLFEKNKIPPTVSVAKGKYRFD